MSKRGFTLIELLITISIISILATIGITTYSSVMKQGRDSKRQSDVRSIQSALEQYFADQLYYPARSADTSASCPPTEGTGTFKLGCPLKDPSGSKTYLNIIPKDPAPADDTIYANYLYISLPKGTCNNLTTNKCISYCLLATLENTSPEPDIRCKILSNTYKKNFAVAPP